MALNNKNKRQIHLVSDYNNGLSVNSSKKKRFLEDVSRLIVNRYDEEAEAPFLVHLIDKREEHNISNIHPMSIGKQLRLNNISLNSIDKLDNDKICLSFNSSSEANEFVSSKVNILNINWLAYVPISATQCIGVVHDIPLDFDDRDIIEGISDSKIK